jgi:maltooligosyltrehalose trehalohydrolase
VLRSPFFHDGTYSRFRGRRHGRPVDPVTVPGWRFVASLQTHDQVGNRAQGDRLSGARLDLDPGVLACGAAILLTSPYTPMLFMGEEWGARTPWQFFTDHTDVAIAEATRDGRRAEFGSHGWDESEVPDPQDVKTFLRSRLDWSETEQEPHARLLRWYRDLIALRRAQPDLRDARLDLMEVSWSDRRLSVGRCGHLVLVNLADEPWTADAVGEVVLSWVPGLAARGGRLELPARTAAVLRR